MQGSRVRFSEGPLFKLSLFVYLWHDVVGVIDTTLHRCNTDIFCNARYVEGTVPNYVTTEPEVPAPLICTPAAAANAWRASSGLCSIQVEISWDILRL